MFARLDRYSNGPGVRAFGRYPDTLINCPDGWWRFTERLPNIESVGAQVPLRREPFPDSAAMRRATKSRRIYTHMDMVRLLLLLLVLLHDS